jgi:hypothetical protein
MTSAEKYVTAAYLVVLAVVLLYVVIYAFKLSRLDRELEELADVARRRCADAAGGGEAARDPETRLTRQ